MAPASKTHVLLAVLIRQHDEVVKPPLTALEGHQNVWSSPLRGSKMMLERNILFIFNFTRRCCITHPQKPAVPPENGFKGAVN